MGGLSSLFKSKSNTTTLEEMISPEQKRARDLLMLYGQTGATPTGYQAGEAYDLSGFDFGLSPYEQQGMAGISSLFAGGEPGGISKARDILTRMANTEFNPEDSSSGLGAFRSALSRETQSAEDILNREAAISGSRYSTGLQRDKVDLAARQSEQMGMKLADLFNTQQNRALQAAGGLAGLEEGAQSMAINRLNALFGAGGLERELRNKRAELAYNDRQRQRDEQLASIGVLKDIYGQKNEWGIKSMTKKTPGIGMAMLGEINPFIGSYNTHQYGYDTNQTSISDTARILAKLFSGGGLS